MEVFGNGTDISKPVKMLFKQTSGAGLSSEVLEKKIKEAVGKPAVMIKNAKMTFGQLKDLVNVQAVVCSTN